MTKTVLAAAIAAIALAACGDSKPPAKAPAAPATPPASTAPATPPATTAPATPPATSAPATPAPEAKKDEEKKADEKK